MTDPISDMFIRIKNAERAGHDSLSLPYSKFKLEIAEVLHRAGFIASIERKGKRVKKILEIKFSREAGHIVRGVRIISKPSRRLYAPYKDLRSASSGGAILISTPKGVMTEKEAKKAKIGGELLAEIW